MRRPSPRRPLRWVLAALAVIAFAAGTVALLNSSSSAPAPPRSLASFFEDDNLLVNQPLTQAGDATVLNTLRTLKTLGVDQLRVLVLWRTVDPAQRPADPTAPSGYGPCGWGVYDRLDLLAHALGIGVLFDLSDPAPAWATAASLPGAEPGVQTPSPSAFAAFVQAAGERYAGGFRSTACPGAALQAAPLPRVSSWSVWNEPNQPGWLAPQYAASGAPAAPALYRDYVDAFWRGMTMSGHTPASDTLLIGELAPQGCLTGQPCGYPGGPQLRPIPPIPFLEDLYCVGANLRPLQGAAATSVGCPAAGGRAAFVAAHPGLFRISGFAHHPYSLLEPPTQSSPESSFVLLADLPRLEHALDTIFQGYGVNRRLPLYLTEYGYVTDPPNPKIGVSLRQQSLYLDEAEYLAWRDQRVRALSQFSLADNPPGPGGNYSGTFQEGLEFINGQPKPALPAYRLPLVVMPRPGRVSAGPLRLRSGQALYLWAMLRPLRAGGRQPVQVQWRPPHGAYRPLATLTSAGRFVTGAVTVPGTGVVRVHWRGISSRGVGITVG